MVDANRWIREKAAHVPLTPGDNDFDKSTDSNMKSLC
jgi:hypothetical protein